jgi:hypothetical protein
MGVNDSFYKVACNHIKETLKATVTGLTDLITPDIIKKVFGVNTKAYTDMMAVNDIDTAIQFHKSASGRNDVWPITAKIGRGISKLSGSQYLTEKGRTQSRILIQRRLSEQLQFGWDDVNPLFKNQILETVGINKKEWESIRSYINYGTVLYHIQPEITTLRNDMFSPMRLHNSLLKNPRSHQNNILLDISKKLEAACLTYINQAQLQGDSLISQMASPKKPLPAGNNPSAVVNYNINKNIDLFMGWSRTFYSHAVYGKGGSLGKYFKILGVMLPAGILTAIILGYAKREDPLKQQMHTIAQGVAMVFGYNSLLFGAEKFLEDLDSITPSSIGKALISGAGKVMPFAIEAPIRLTTRIIGTLYYGFRGETAKAMHSARKIVPFRNYVPAKNLLDRVILDNIFDMINSEEAKREWEMEMKDASNRFTSLSTLPGDLTQDKFSEHVREMLKHKYKMD